ncbi:PAN domain containing protein [Ditylenchus destructor]|uniref:PAN domain containing protein n=1 Tax=Ditylenchus destructor TaxID=166010 RepID=A0AAD4NDM4_9BILA|nr:PAN domain containing protein [Ditylenchus destructor]
MGMMSRVSIAAPLAFSRMDIPASAENIIPHGIPLVLQPSAIASPAFVTACIVTFQLFEEISIEDIQVTRVVSVSSLNECAYICYQQSCSHAFYEPLNHSESADFNARCSLDTSSLKETCNWNVERHYSLKSVKPTVLSCLRCEPAKPTRMSHLYTTMATPLVQKDYKTNDNETPKSISYHPLVQTELTATVTVTNLENEGSPFSADFPTTKEDALSEETTVSTSVNTQNFDTTESLSYHEIWKYTSSDEAMSSAITENVSSLSSTENTETTESGRQHISLYNTVKSMQANNAFTNPTQIPESTTEEYINFMTGLYDNQTDTEGITLSSPLPTPADDEIIQTEDYELLEMPTKPTLPPALANMHRPKSVGVVVPARFPAQTIDHNYSTEEPMLSTFTSETSSMASASSRMIPSTQDEIKSTKDMDDNIIGTMGFDSTMITTTEESNQGFSKKLSSGTTNESLIEPTTELKFVEDVSSFINMMNQRTTQTLPEAKEFNARDDKPMEEVAQLIDSVANHRNNFEELVRSSNGKEGEFGADSMNITEMSGTFRLSHNSAAQGLKIDLYYNKNPRR